jgi:hypothetical protein
MEKASRRKENKVGGPRERPQILQDTVCISYLSHPKNTCCQAEHSTISCCRATWRSVCQCYIYGGKNASHKERFTLHGAEPRPARQGGCSVSSFVPEDRGGFEYGEATLRACRDVSFSNSSPLIAQYVRNVFLHSISDEMVVNIPHPQHPI